LDNVVLVRLGCYGLLGDVGFMTKWEVVLMYIVRF
jgi:hypothetical protein